MPINKVWDSFERAVEDVFDGATVMVGGFGGSGGCPSYLIRALAEKGVKDLTIVTNLGGYGRELIEKVFRPLRPGLPQWWDDVGLLFERGQVKKAILPYPVHAMQVSVVTPIEKQFAAGKVEVEMVPMGTLVERIRAAKAGLGGFYTPVGVGTLIEKGKEVRIIDGKEFILEFPLKADFALIRAYKADRLGNLIYRGTSRALNSTMAGAATVTVAEVDEVVPPGELDPEEIVTPAIYVDRVVVRPEEGKLKIKFPLRKWEKTGGED